MLNQLLLIAVFLAPLPAGPLQTRAGSVAGTLLSNDGQPAVGIRVSAMAVPDATVPGSTASTLLSFVMTDSAGRYRLDNVPAGRYYVTAGLVDLPTYYPGVASLGGATAVSVAAGAAVTGIDFRMAVPAGVTVSGRAIFPPSPANAAPPALATRLALIGAGVGGVQETTLGPDGSFQFLKIRPGSYTLMLSAVAVPQTSAITVADKDVTGIEIVVPLTVIITGTAIVEGGGPIPRFALTFASFEGRGSGAASGATATNGVLNQGQLRTQLPEGEYRVSWSNLPAGYSLKSITAGSVDLLANPFKVATGAPPPPVNVLLGVSSPPPWVKVSGRIVSPQPIQPGVRYQVALTGTPTNPMDAVRTTAIADGSFEFSRVPAGSYTVRLTLPGLLVPPTSLAVGNKDLSGVEIAVPAMKELSGRVTIEGLGQIAPRLSFNVADSSGVVAPPAAAEAQPDGTFRLTLPEGERRVTLTVPGYTVKALSYGTVDVLREPLLRISSTDSAQFQIALVALPTGGVVGNPGGVTGGVLGGILRPTEIPREVVRIEGTPISQPPPLPPQRLGGDVAQANLLTTVNPVYPADARAARVQGVVMLQATIDREGKVTDLRVIRGHPLLNDAAVDAVKQWRYKPQTLNGQPIEVITTITVNFSFQE